MMAPNILNASAASESQQPSFGTENEYTSNSYTIREEPYGTKRPIKVILMGAGASTLNFLKKAEEQLSNVEIVVFEKNEDVGGTWFENRYPGCACDIPSVNYQFSWKIKLWTHYYSYAPEILAYLKSIERENNFIEKYIRLQHRIDRAEWDASSGQWHITVRNLLTQETFIDKAEFFINAGGVLNSWKWPNIEGLQTFKGKLMHSANYEVGYELEGKKVAVIGAGSSGVQIVAAIQKRVEKLYHTVKSPIWITAGFAQRWAAEDGANFAYSQKQLDYLQDNPKKYLEYRKQIENELNQRFKFIIRDSAEFHAVRDYAETEMRRKLKNDQRLCDTMIPKTFNPGCRRPTPAPGYLEALIAPNVTVLTEAIVKVDESGFFDSHGNHYDADVIICATGFDTSWIPRFPFIGRDETALSSLWSSANGVTSYLSISIPYFPNHFSFCGPYGPLGHGSFMPLIETWTRYMFSVITKAQVENIKSLTPSMRAAAQFRQHADEFLKRTAWTMPCSSWFKQGKVDGQPAVYPGSRVQFLELLEHPRYEDFEIEYWDENRFAFLGNGFSAREHDGRDITGYLGLLEPEKGDIQPEYDEDLIKVLGGCYIEDERA